MVQSVVTHPHLNSSQRRRSDETVIALHNLTKQYGKRLAVNNFSLEIKRGDIFGFLGPNGAGKTTTIRMLLGLIKPTSGRIEILGTSIHGHQSQVLPRLGALIETPALYLYMSGRDNLIAVASALGGVPASRIDEVLNIVGLADRQKDRVRTYSLGMKQRLGVAIALLNDPEILVLDEPANGLDPAGIAEMRDLMQRLAEQGKTVFISSHILSEIQQICDRVAIISQGQLITETTIEDLLSGKGEFEVKLENAQDALMQIQRQSWGQNARLKDDQTIITTAPNNRGRDLNLFLVQAGFAPDSLTQTVQDLEKVFLTLTNTDSKGVK